MSNIRITVKPRNVNSTSLFKMIDEHIQSTINGLGYYWFKTEYRNLYIEHLEETIGEYIGNGKITQFKLICNSRNNNATDTENGIYRIDLQYKQAHCLNTTSLSYVLEYLGELSHLFYE